MVNQNFHTIYFQPSKAYFNYYPNNFTNVPNPSRIRSSFLTNEYVVRGIAVIQYIIRCIQSTSAFIEENITVIRELPKMYQILRAFHEIKQSEGENTNSSEVASDNINTRSKTAPKLFI